MHIYSGLEIVLEHIVAVWKRVFSSTQPIVQSSGVRTPDRLIARRFGMRTFVQLFARAADFVVRQLVIQPPYYTWSKLFESNWQFTKFILSTFSEASKGLRFSSNFIYIKVNLANFLK